MAHRINGDAKDRPMTNPTTRIHSAERACGTRAAYHVYYRLKGKLLFDPSWEQTPQAAIEAISGFLKGKADIIKVISLTPTF